MEIDLPSARRSLWRRQPYARRGHPCPREEKSGEKNRGGDITSIRLRRSLFFVAPATPAGAPKLPQAAAPEARSCCRTKLHRMRRRCGRTSFGPGAWMARLGRKSGVGMAVRLAVGAKGSHNQKPPAGPPRPPPSQCSPAHFCPELPGIARLGGASEQVSAHRPPFSVGLTTSAVSGSSRRPPGSLRCGLRKMNPC